MQFSEKLRAGYDINDIYVRGNSNLTGISYLKDAFVREKYLIELARQTSGVPP